MNLYAYGQGPTVVGRSRSDRIKAARRQTPSTPEERDHKHVMAYRGYFPNCPPLHWDEVDRDWVPYFCGALSSEQVHRRRWWLWP